MKTSRNGARAQRNILAIYASWRAYPSFELAKNCASVYQRFEKIRYFRLQPGRQGRYWKESMRSKLASRVFYRTRCRAPERHPEPEREIRDAASEMVCFDKRPRDHRRRLALGQRRDRLGRGGGLARERGGPHRRSRSGSDFASRQRPTGAGPVTNPTNGATVGAGADPDRGKGRCPRAGGEPPAGPSSADR